MTYVIAVLATLVRFFRPSRGTHAAPFAMRRDIRQEARAARSRRYVPTIPPARPSGPGYNPFAAVAPVRGPYVSPPPAAMVRGHLRAHEARAAVRTVEKVAA
jgi:hypothetical protein